MRIALVDCGSGGVGRIRSILHAGGAAVDTMALAQVRSATFQRMDAVVISGGPHLYTAAGMGDALADRFDFIDQLMMPILGICLGHQAIGVRFGARVYRGQAIRRAEPIRLVQPHPLFAGIPAGTAFVEDHTEGISLPPGFSCLADSCSYPVEAMVHGSRPLYGVQFHPEISGGAGERLLRNFLRLAHATCGQVRR